MAETLTRATIWIAMVAWTAGICFDQRGNSRRGFPAWGFGFIAYVTHIVFAYGAFYGWSHVMAWEATARDTKEVTGFDSGVGLLVNYAFALVLAIDLFSQWRRGRRWIARWINGLVLFMIVNGAVVFGQGAVRALGVLLSLVILWSLFRKRKSHPDSV